MATKKLWWNDAVDSMMDGCQERTLGSFPQNQQWLSHNESQFENAAEFVTYFENASAFDAALWSWLYSTSHRWRVGEKFLWHLHLRCLFNSYTKTTFTIMIIFSSRLSCLFNSLQQTILSQSFFKTQNNFFVLFLQQTRDIVIHHRPKTYKWSINLFSVPWETSRRSFVAECQTIHVSGDGDDYVCYFDDQ